MSAPYVRTPTELPDLRTWMLGQWNGGVYLFHSLPAIISRLRAIGLAPPTYAGYAQWEIQALRGASLWWVAPEMVDVLVATIPSIPPDVRLSDLTPPSRSGLVVFGSSLAGVDADQPDRRVTMDALVWGPTVYGRGGNPRRPELDGTRALGLSWYRRLSFDEGLGGAELSMAAALGLINHGRLEPVSSTREELLTAIGQDPSKPLTEVVGAKVPGREGTYVVGEPGNPAPPERLRGTTWAPLGRSDWPEGDRLDRPPWSMTDGEATAYTEGRQIIAALWLLLTQRAIAATHVRPADRPAQRRQERAGVDRETARAGVRIVTLRKTDRPEPAGSTDDRKRRPADHRWIVRPHACWQPYGPGRSLRKLIVRGPYVAGPPDAPLQTPEVVNAWKR